jgi:hypothetical protein
MTARIAYDPVNGTALTETNLEKFPGGWIGYVEVTANQTGLAAGVDLTGLAETVTVNTSRRIRISTFCTIQGSAGGDLARLDIKEGATILNSFQGRLETSGIGFQCSVVLLPSAAAHTYKLTVTRTVGAGTVQLSASATAPAYLLIEDLGPSA